MSPCSCDSKGCTDMAVTMETARIANRKRRQVPERLPAEYATALSMLAARRESRFRRWLRYRLLGWT